MTNYTPEQRAAVVEEELEIAAKRLIRGAKCLCATGRPEAEGMILAAAAVRTQIEVRIRELKETPDEQ